MRISKLFAATVVLLGGSACWGGNLVYYITANTSPAAGSPEGYLDFQFNPGSVGSAAAATATVAQFFSDGVLDTSGPALVVNGDETGDLSTTLTLGNTSTLNEYSPGFTFGNLLRFQLTLAWDETGPTPTSGTAFVFYLSDANFSFANNQSPNGQALEVDINTDNTTTLSNYSADVAGSPAISVSTQPFAATPEPASWMLLTAAAALAGLRAATRRVRTRR